MNQVCAKVVRETAGDAVVSRELVVHHICRNKYLFNIRYFSFYFSIFYKFSCHVSMYFILFFFSVTFITRLFMISCDFSDRSP